MKKSVVVVSSRNSLGRAEPVRGKSPNDNGPLGLVSPVGSGKDPITADALYPRWANFLKPDDIIIAETGTSSMGLALATMPKGASFHNQTLWGSIGWATPAAFGAAVAAPHRRLILFTGEGSHQLTAQEISQMGRRGLKNVIVFVLNNSGYLIERLLCKHPDFVYNDLAEWHYSELPHALGCYGWFTARVTTCGELDQALTTKREKVIAAHTSKLSPTSMLLHRLRLSSMKAQRRSTRHDWGVSVNNATTDD